MNGGYADVTYKETRQLRSNKNNELLLTGLIWWVFLQSYRKITFADIALGRHELVLIPLRVLVDFVANYPGPNQKGLYIYGDMGLENPSCWLLWLMNFQGPRRLPRPLFITIFYMMVKTESGQFCQGSNWCYQTGRSLVLDDIGAEQFSSGLGMMFLQVILQHRMIEGVAYLLYV